MTTVVKGPASSTLTLTKPGAGTWFLLLPATTSPHNDNSCEWVQLAPGPGLASTAWGSGPRSSSWTGHSPSSYVRPVTSRWDRRRKSQPRASEATSAGLHFKEVHALEPHTAQQVGSPRYPFHNPRWGICKKCLLTAPRSQVRLHLFMLTAATAAWGWRSFT